MKSKVSISIFILASTFLLSCEKKVFEKDYTGSFQANYSGLSLVKVVYASVNNSRDSVQIKLNTNRVSNKFLSPTTGNLPVPQPGGGLNTGGSNFPDYFSVPTGPLTVSVSIPKMRSIEDSLVRFTGSATLEEKQKYTAFITDTAANAKLVLVKEDGILPETGTSIFKFVNLIPNRPAMDLYFGPLPVALNIAYGAASPTFKFPTGLAAQWAIRPAGALPTSTPIAVYPGTVAAPTNQTVPEKRIFTVFCKGYAGITGIRLPTISLVYN